MDNLKKLIQRLFNLSQKQIVVPAEPADFIVERYTRYYPSWGNDRVTYRIRHWLPEDSRYSFEGEQFWIGNVHMKLRSMGVEDPYEVPIVDIDPPRG